MYVDNYPLLLFCIDEQTNHVHGCVFIKLRMYRLHSFFFIILNQLPVVNMRDRNYVIRLLK